MLVLEVSLFLIIRCKEYFRCFSSIFKKGNNKRCWVAFFFSKIPFKFKFYSILKKICLFIFLRKNKWERNNSSPLISRVVFFFLNYSISAWDNLMHCWYINFISSLDYAAFYSFLIWLLSGYFALGLALFNTICYIHTSWKK